MLNTYIKNKGITQTIIHNSNNNQNEFNEFNPRSYISSPLANEEIIVPITIDDKKHKHHKYTLTAKKHHRRKKTHNTYKAYKRHKSSTKSAKIRRSKSRSNSKRASSQPFSIF